MREIKGEWRRREGFEESAVPGWEYVEPEDTECDEDLKRAYLQGHNRGFCEGDKNGLQRGDRSGFARGIRFTVVTTAVIGFLLWLACRLSGCSELVLFGG